MTESTNLQILQDTFFKATPTDSSSLSNNQKVRLTAGQTFKINNYQPINGHFKVELTSPLVPVGNVGYLYDKHVEITQTNPIFSSVDPANIPPGCSLLTINQTTQLKTKPEDSSELSSRQKLELTQGQNFYITGYTCLEGHFRVSFLKEIANFGRFGYLYAPHIKIQKDGKVVQFETNPVILTVLKTTLFKKRPVDGSTLKLEEQITLPAGWIYGVTGYQLESGHLKVSITENIPGFGNTGYFFPDFIQLSQGGKNINTSPALTYQSATEFLVKEPATLTGTFDPKQVANVRVLAEDKFALPVVLNKNAGTWQVILNQGFQEPGARWLRLRGSDSNGRIVASLIINLTVSDNAMTVGKELTLKILTDTFFKIALIDAEKLNNQQKFLVKSGQNLSISKYGFVDGHLKVTLNSALAPLGTFGYFYEPHIQLSKGNQVLKFDIEDVPDTQLTAEMLVTETTWIKSKPIDSSTLPANQKAELLLGQNFAITGYACIKGHYRITLAQSIPNFGNIGYIYWRHIQLKKDNNIIAYDPKALTATVLQNTAFKKKPIDTSKLSNTEKIGLPTGRNYGISSYGLEDGHIKVAFTEDFPNFGNTGYLYPPHIKMRRGSQTFNPFPNQVELNVPHFSQRDNPRFYWSTCNVTSIAMALYYYGMRTSWGGQLEDELLQWCLNKYGEGSQTDHSVLSQLIRAYGYKSTFNTNRTWLNIQTEIINRRPCILAGDFTATGHIVCVVGYTPQGLIVNDPWGDALTGYADTEGAKLFYPYSYLNRVAGPDGNIWAHFISR